MSKKLIIPILFLFITSVTSFSQNSYKVNLGELNVRSGPGTKYEVLGIVNYGEIITTDSPVDNHWYKFDFKGKTGYISSKYVVPVEVSPKPEDENTTKEQGNDIWSWGSEGYSLITYPVDWDAESVLRKYLYRCPNIIASILEYLMWFIPGICCFLYFILKKRNADYILYLYPILTFMWCFCLEAREEFENTEGYLGAFGTLLLSCFLYSSLYLITHFLYVIRLNDKTGIAINWLHLGLIPWGILGLLVLEANQLNWLPNALENILLIAFLISQLIFIRQLAIAYRSRYKMLLVIAIIIMYLLSSFMAMTMFVKFLVGALFMAIIFIILASLAGGSSKSKGKGEIVKYINGSKVESEHGIECTTTDGKKYRQSFTGDDYEEIEEI